MRKQRNRLLHAVSEPVRDTSEIYVNVTFGIQVGGKIAWHFVVVGEDGDWRYVGFNFYRLNAATT